MSHDTPPLPPNTAQPTHPPSRDGAGRILVGLGIGCLVMVLVCGGLTVTLVALLVPWAETAIQQLTEKFGEGWSDDPLRVREVADLIAPIELPAAFEPQVCYMIERPAGGAPWVAIAIYAETAGDGMLVLGSLELLSQDPAAIEQHLQEWLDDGRLSRVDWEDAQQIELRVRDAPARFYLVRGSTDRYSREYWQAVGTFQGTASPACLLLRVPTDEYDHDQVLDLIHSIR